MRQSFATPTFQFAWDSTSLGTLKECPRKYYYSIVLGYRPRHESVHLTFGIFIHQGIEFYHRYKATDKDHEQSLRATVFAMMNATWDHEKKRPWTSDDNNKNRWTLIRTLVWYLDHFRDDAAAVYHFPDGKPAVELSFRYELGLTISGQSILMCGHMDRIVTFEDNLYVADSKTTKNTIDDNFFKKFSPDNQMTNYTIGGKVALHTPVKGVIVDGMQIAVDFSRFRRGFASRSDDQLNEWLDDTKYYISSAYSFSQASHWPMNDKACHNYNGCQFRDICSKAHITREKWLEADFVKLEWDPLKIRGDI